ncbi:MutS-related protein [Tissierella sp.]|uniref:MutS family DNA mismatch repair protein n=1 Tax=Tissierella sp. TaxID=41274 RepID=UPI00286E6E26|nr:DNA mismatch repair protein [Tissierella sp.]
MSIFVFLVIKHNKLKANNRYFHAFNKINEDALLRLKGDWNNFGDTGAEFRDDNHSFSNDLDIFGQASLFQYINTTTTYMGRDILRKYLTQPCKDKEVIRNRQKAIDELSCKLPWRQRFMAEGLIVNNKSNDHDALYEFFETKNEMYTKYWLIIGAGLIPMISIGFFLLAIFKKIPFQIPILMLAIQIILLIFKYAERSKQLDLVYRHVDSIKVYRKMINYIEKRSFKSEYLIKLKDKLVDIDKLTACQQIKELENIADSISNRNNPYFMIINIITLWDYQCMIALEQWKKKSGLLIRTWFETVGEFEALSSLANIGHDNPDWTIPKIIDNPYYIMAKDMGHPLLTDKRVCNDFKIDGSTKVLLITGSNMSGKSTYLRTIGINLILAYAGAPVCAKDFCCSIFNIYTCMRVSDSLEQNTSSFYAELLRIKKIVDESKTNNVFFLLDEVFKGTNSHDRHEGAKILINKLINNMAIGLVSTHDLELEVLERESNGKIRNYHFKEYYKNNKIYFDYKINRGISTTKNAMYLIKMIGIDD